MIKIGDKVYCKKDSGAYIMGHTYRVKMVYDNDDGLRWVSMDSDPITDSIFNCWFCLNREGVDYFYDYFEVYRKFKLNKLQDRLR